MRRFRYVLGGLTVICVGIATNEIKSETYLVDGNTGILNIESVTGN